MRWPSRREWGLLAIALAVILFAAHAERQRASSAAAVVEPRPAGRAAPRAAAVPLLDLERLQRGARGLRPQDVFAAKSWNEAPKAPAPEAAAKPASAVNAPPAPPSAPPLPFSYLGRYAAAERSVFFLVRGDRILMARQGDVIDGTYRVEGIVGSLLGLTYLPLNVRQNLDTEPAG
jgi:hypothetical protein